MTTDTTRLGNTTREIVANNAKAAAVALRKAEEELGIIKSALLQGDRDRRAVRGGAAGGQLGVFVAELAAGIMRVDAARNVAGDEHRDAVAELIEAQIKAHYKPLSTADLRKAPPQPVEPQPVEIANKHTVAQLPADSIIRDGGIVLTRMPSGNWMGIGARKGGIATETVIASQAPILLLYRGSDPVLWGRTEAEYIHDLAEARGWAIGEHGARATRLVLTRGEVSLTADFSNGKCRKASRRVGGTETAVSANKMDALYHWLTEDDSVEEDTTPLGQIRAAADEAGWEYVNNRPSWHKFSRGRDVINVRVTSSTGRIARAERGYLGTTQPDDSVADKDKLGTVLRWLNEQEA